MRQKKPIKSTSKNISGKKNTSKNISGKKNTSKNISKRKKKIVLRASQAEQWANCSKLLDLGLRLSDPFRNNKPAQQGTALHTLIEKILYSFPELFLSGRCTLDTIASYLKTILAVRIAIKDRIFLEKNFDEILPTIHFCLQKIIMDFQTVSFSASMGEVKYGFETRVSRSTPEYFISGQPDFYIYHLVDGKLYLTVYDFKFGQVEVEVEDNLQLDIYAHLIIQNIIKRHRRIFVVKELTGVIIQPKLKSISTSEIFYNENRLDHLYTEPEKRKFVTGSHCTYCDFVTICPEFKKVLKLFLNPELQDFSMDRFDMWADLLQFAKPVKKMLETAERQVKDVLLSRSAETDKISLTWHNGRRAWLNDKTVLDLSRDLKLRKSELHKTSIKTPAEVEKLLKSKGVDKKTVQNRIEKINELVFQSTHPRLKIHK